MKTIPRINRSWLNHGNRSIVTVLLGSIVVLSMILSACGDDQPLSELTIEGQTTNLINPEISVAPSETSSPIPTTTPRSSTASGDHLPVWGTYEGPSLNPVTEIPPYLRGLIVPEEILVWVLLGMDTEIPFTGRTPAIHVILINPRTAKASMVSIPGSLYVYIPGYTMQRISVAYAIGGMALLRTTLEYNFGLTVDRFVLAHPGDFQWLVDDVGGVEVSVLYPMPKTCGGIPAGPQIMNGNKALCYVSYLSNMDEVDRLRRQQQVLRLIFLNMVDNGNLSRLPVLYASYKDWIVTDLTLEELTSYIPLALKLADPERIKYFIIGWDAISIWDLPGNSQVQVFLPDQKAILDIMNNAVNLVMEPSPLSDLVTTLVYELTAIVPTQSLSTALTPVVTGTQVGTPFISTPTRTPTLMVQPTNLYP
jgi:LCP family protein required for cell wall assembly